MAKRTDNNQREAEGTVSERGEKSNRGSSGRGRKPRRSPTVVDLEPSTESSGTGETGAKESNPRGLRRRDAAGTSRNADAAKERLDEIITGGSSAAGPGGRPSLLSLRPPELPFEASLAFAFRRIGGKSVAIEYARLSARFDEKFEKLVWAYDQLSQSDQEKIRLEDLCASVELSPSEFLGTVTRAAYSHNLDVANLIAAVNHPRVVEATLASAIDNPYGTEDRRMLHQHHGFLPQPKGQTIQINNQPQAFAAANAKAAAASEASSTGPGLPTFEQDGIEIVQAIRGDAGVGLASLPQPARAALPAAPEHIIDVPAERSPEKEPRGENV
jgi:hypothetical protein